MLIEAVNDLPEEVLVHVSPQSVRLKRYIKVPLLILLINAGFQSGLSVVFLKLCGELVVAGDAGSHISMLLIMIAGMLTATLSQVHSLNLAMKHFD